jgi:hypothetical protein
VARQFFQAGKASQTIALTISAYDMTFSDVIYGKEKSGRYVCDTRLRKMLSLEFSKLTDRLGAFTRGGKTCFFSFADTVATASDSDKKKCSQAAVMAGWASAFNTNRMPNPAKFICMSDF